MALSFPRGGFPTDDFFGAQRVSSSPQPLPALLAAAAAACRCHCRRCRRLPPPLPPLCFQPLPAPLLPPLTRPPRPPHAAAPFFTGFPDMTRELSRALAPLESQAGTQLATRGVPIDVVSADFVA